MEAVRGWKPTAIAHLAYRKDDRRIIVEGSRNVAAAASVAGARMIHMSTDVVFPGRAAPYGEGDPVFPLNDYGRAKADAEAAVMAADPGAVLVRTSLIFGTDHLGAPQTDVQAAVRGSRPFTFYTDEVRCPIHAADLAAAISALATMPEVSGPLHVGGPEALDRLAFATLIARWLGLNPATLQGAPQPVGLPRPGVLILDSSRAAGLGLRPRAASDWLRPV